MERDLKEVKFLLGNRIGSVEELINFQSFELFSDLTLCFLSDISNFLFKNPEIRKYPDVATFAFFCRKSNLNKIKRLKADVQNFSVGKGILFHITPGNVPVNFAYSLFAGLITGNINIVKVPSKDFEQVNIIINAIKIILSADRYKEVFSKRLYVVKYSKDNLATEFFSSFCDVRIIWGGDFTVNEVRKFPISPSSTEVTFSDRYSIAIINAKSYLKSNNKNKVAEDFYNDTYLFDQNACTSPHAIFWVGNKIDAKGAQQVFWNLFQNKLQEKKFELQPVHVVDKLTTFFSQAISIENIRKESQKSNEILRVSNNTPHNDIHLFKCNSGYFNETIISTLNQITPVINRKYQTIGYFGFSVKDLKIWIKTDKPLGVDRIVPIGRTMDFSLIWDGYDLISAFSRKIEIF
jgi:hypothetical protein